MAFLSCKLLLKHNFCSKMHLNDSTLPCSCLRLDQQSFSCPLKGHAIALLRTKPRCLAKKLAPSFSFSPNPHTLFYVVSFIQGISYFMSRGILVDHPKEIAKFIFYTRMLNWKMLRIYLDERFVSSFLFFISFYYCSFIVYTKLHISVP